MSAPVLADRRFSENRPPDLRRTPPWHRLAYIVRRLPAELEALAGELEVGPAGRVLDFGCADLAYRRFFPAGVEYVGADLAGNPMAMLEIASDGTLTAPDASFDAVLSTQVLEHAEDPEVHLAECARVLRPGGRLLLSTHGLMIWHPDPVDLWRWTSQGLPLVVERAGLDVIRFEGIMGLTATGVQMTQDGLLARLPRRLHGALALVFQTLAALADRLDGRESRRMNALVFALVASKP